MTCTALLKEIIHIFKILHMPALIGRHGNSMRIFLNRCRDDFIDTTVVPQMHHLNARRLDDASHNIYGGIMPIKKRGCGYNSNFMFWTIGLWLLHCQYLGR